MKQRIYQVDAFTDKVFGGNPAAVVPLREWLNDELLQNIAMENNLAETAFYVKNGDEYDVRWFTPLIEVDLCGHATLAAAFVLYNHENHPGDIIQFNSPRSGALTVTRNKDLLTLNFPTDNYQHMELSKELTSAFNGFPKRALKGKTDYVLVFQHERDIINLKPDLSQVATLGGRGVIVTAKGEKVDFVSRFFAPQAGIDEDPVTGSAHTTLILYWASELGKNELTAIQLSKRKGYLQCKFLGNRVEISGKAKLYMVGEIFME